MEVFSRSIIMDGTEIENPIKSCFFSLQIRLFRLDLSF